VGWGPWTLIGDPKPVPSKDAVELVHPTIEDAETAEDAPADDVVPMKRGRRPARPQD
jgi:hypothetical protein